MSNTKLFNIRITHEQHKKFKKYAEKNGFSMGGILTNYIETLINGETEFPIGFEDNRPKKRVEKVDPLAHIRDQYKPGRDF